MLSENILMLRNKNGYSQEEVAERIGISRQAYAKWEKGETVPDVERCQRLAELYNTTIDSIINFSYKVGNKTILPGPKGKHIFGTVKVNEQGQITLPKAAREVFEIDLGDMLVILGDEERGLALIKAEEFRRSLDYLRSGMQNVMEE